MSDVSTVSALMILAGDVDMDGEVDLLDAIAAGQCMVDLLPDVSIYKQADVNNDNCLGLAEMEYILKRITDVN